MGSRVLVFARKSHEMESILQSIKTFADIEVVGTIQDPGNIVLGVRNISADVLLIREESSSPAILEITSKLRSEGGLSGIVVMLGGAIDNASVIALLKAGVNAIISADVASEDLGIAIREASGNRLFIPPRRREST